jgi:hypothetical protein
LFVLSAVKRELCVPPKGNHTTRCNIPDSRGLMDCCKDRQIQEFVLFLPSKIVGIVETSNKTSYAAIGCTCSTHRVLLGTYKERAPFDHVMLKGKLNVGRLYI